MAQSPLTNEIFVATELIGASSTAVLRYQSNGVPDVNWSTFNTPSDPSALLFDMSGRRGWPLVRLSATPHA